MGITQKWQATFLEALKALKLGYRAHNIFPSVFVIEHKPVAFHLIGLATADEQTVKNLHQHFHENGIQLINLWEDIWHYRRDQVLSRLLSMADLNKRVFARNCAIEAVTQNSADQFLERNHLQGTAKARYRYALKMDGRTLAIATFNIRPMPSKGKDYYSAELIRFCSLSGVTIVGGLSKLIVYFVNLEKPADIMTYADRDWSNGTGYSKLGFKLAGTTPFMELWLTPGGNRITTTRLMSSRSTGGADETGYTRVFNSGNLKFIKKYES